MKKKYLSICIGTAILLSLCSCKSLDKSLYPWKYAPSSPANQPIPPTASVPTLPKVDVKAGKTSKEFIAFKNSGIQAMQQNRLTLAINFFMKALAIKPDEEIDRYLQECYFERGEYYYSLGKIDEALRDLAKSNLKQSIQLQQKILGDTTVVLDSPLNQSIQRLEIITFKWTQMNLADFYMIRMEDSKSKVIVSQNVIKNEWICTVKLKMDETYYWSVRAHLPNGTWSEWSEKWQFILRSAQFEREQFVLTCKPYTYQQLTETSELFRGKSIVLTGQVVQVIKTSTNVVDLLVNITLQGTDFKDTILVQFTKFISDKVTISEGDVITAWGTYHGLITYQSILGESMILPNVATQYLTIQKKKDYLKNKE